MRRHALCCLFLVAAPTALAGSAAVPGVGETSILIGGVAPPAAGVVRGATAYFRYVNSRGGVNGREIVYRVLDDDGDPAQALEAAHRLVAEERVFALFDTVGTGTSLAIRDFLDRAGVPQLFVASGATAWGRDANRYPWTIGYTPTYRTEGIALARHALKTKPRARIAVLYTADEDGSAFLAGVRRGLGARAAQIVKAAGYDPAGTDVAAQVAALRGSKADTLVVFAGGRLARKAMAVTGALGWRPRVYLNAAASAWVAPPAAVSTAFVKNAGDPRWSADPGLGLVGRFARAGDLTNPDFVAGLASGFTLVDALKKAGRKPTRAGIMAVARGLNEANNPFVLPGIVIKTGSADAYPIEQVALQRRSQGRWKVFTGPLAIAG